VDHEKSVDALRHIPDGLDFVYIDGNHEEAFVREDIVCYYKKIKPGGVIGRQDFYDGFCREHEGVVRAVCQFSVENRMRLQVELPDRWIKK
jgi:hypothetical protein